MPTIFNPNQNLDENGNPIPEISNSTNSNVVDSGSAPQAQDSKAPTSSGSFTNLKSYLDANKDSQFGSQFANRVGAVGDEASNTLDSSKQSVTNKIDSGKVNYNPDLVNKALNDPSKFVQDQNNVQQFTQMRDAQYKGPKQFNETEEFGKSQKAVERAAQTAEASKTGHGRQALMGDFFARPDYYAGMKRLDNLIVQNDPNARQQLQQAQQKVEPIQANFRSLGDYLSNYAQQADLATKAARKQTRDALGLQEDGTVKGGAIGGLDKTVSDRLAARQNEFDKNVPVISNALANADLTQLTPQQRNSLGLTNDLLDSSFVDYLWNVKPNDTKFLKTKSRNDLNKSSVASKDEYARINALAQLAGIDNTFVPDEALAGTLDDESLYSYDANAFVKAVNDAAQAAALNRADNWTVAIDPASTPKEIADKWAPNGQLTMRQHGGFIDDLIKRAEANEYLKPAGLDSYKQRIYDMYSKPFQDRAQAERNSLQRLKK